MAGVLRTLVYNQLVARIPESTIIDCLDRGSGSADPASLDALIMDATSYLIERIAAIYPGWDSAPLFQPPYPPAIIRLTTDVCHAYLGERYPAYLRVNGTAMFVRVDKELKQVRVQEVTLGAAPPDPAQNQGGVVYQDTNDIAGSYPPLFQTGVGSY